MAWESVIDKLPKYTDLYNVVCEIGDIGGGYTDVRSYRYRIVDGKPIGWQIPDVFDEIVTVTHWQQLPPPPSSHNSNYTKCQNGGN